MAEFARGFCLTLPDGTTLDGAQFPNGMVVTCHREAGLRTAAMSIGHLLDGVEPGSVRVLWAPETDEPDRATPLQGPVPPPGVIFMTKEPPCEQCVNSPYRCIEHSEEN